MSNKALKGLTALIFCTTYSHGVLIPQKEMSSFCVFLFPHCDSQLLSKWNLADLVRAVKSSFLAGVFWKKQHGTFRNLSRIYPEHWHSIHPRTQTADSELMSLFRPTDMCYMCNMSMTKNPVNMACWEECFTTDTLVYSDVLEVRFKPRWACQRYESHWTIISWWKVLQCL